jgi:hypothetical protein
MYLLDIAQSENNAARPSCRVEKRIYRRKNKSPSAGFADDFALETAYIFIFLQRVAKRLSSIEKSVGKNFGEKPAYCFFMGESRNRSSSAVERYYAHSPIDGDDPIRDAVENAAQGVAGCKTGT